MEAKILLLALMTVAIRLFGNLSTLILAGIDPRPVAIKKRLSHWLVSLFAAFIFLLLAPIVASI
tara:strand:- start:307 stop:498 length:192 start_codon:yes stop_codon:yes gene_type:complete